MNLSKKFINYKQEFDNFSNSNFFKNKNILILKKKSKSFYYDNLLAGIVEYGKPKKTFYIKYDSKSSFLNISNEIEKVSKFENIDIFICASYYFILPEVLKNLQDNIYRIRIDGDDVFHFNSYSKWYAQFFDLNITNCIFSKNKFIEFKYNSITYVSPFKKLDVSKNHLSKIYDISFVGLIKNKLARSEYIEHIRQNDYNINIFGSDSPSGYLDQNEVFKIYQNTKINLNFTGITQSNKSINNPLNSNTMTGRIFEIIGSGGFLITEYNVSIEYFFEPGKDLVIFKNKSDLIEKINYYIKNPSERNIIANNGYNKFIKYYNYPNYMPHFIDQISSNSQNKNIINSYKWPKELRIFLTRFINKKYFFNISYLYVCFKFTTKDFILKKILNFIGIR